MQLQVALDEIVSNVVKYSWPDDGKHEVFVRITVNATGVVLDIFDDGRPFDPRAAPKPKPPLNGQRPRPGGVGIHMTKKLVDNLASVSYTHLLNEKGDLFSIERLSQELSATHHADPVEIVRVIKNAVDKFAGSAPKSDDVTALALRWRPAEQVAEKVGT